MLGWLYTLLLHLYPRRFHDEFASEMRAVFEDVLAEATDRHLCAWVAIFWRELRGLPRAVIVTHLREWRQVMGLETRNVVDRYIPWWAMLAAVALFVLLALVPFESVVPAPLGLALLFGLLTFVLVVFVVDAIKIRHLPRWSLPYAGFILSILVLSGPSPADRQMAYLRSWAVSIGDELSRFVWQAITSGLFWFSMLAVLGVGVLAFALLPPLRPTFAKVRQDWTRLSFLLYGAVVFVYIVDFDEYRHHGGYVLAGALSLALGTWFYLRGKTTRRRILALLSGMTLAMWTMAVGKWIIVPRQDWPVWFGWHAPETERWFESGREVIAWGWMMVAVSAPGLLGLLPRRKEAASPAPSM